MGMYLNRLPNGEALPVRDKAAEILENVDGARVIEQPEEWVPDLVCVVTNSWGDAAGYCFDKIEFAHWTYPDARPKVWLIVPGAKELAS